MNGDDTRHWIPQTEGESTFFLGVNFNKRSIVLDLKNEAGQKNLRELFSDTDVVLQGYKKSTAHKLKVNYDTLREINPRNVYCEISGDGRKGPRGKYPGYQVTVQVFSG